MKRIVLLFVYLINVANADRNIAISPIPVDFRAFAYAVPGVNSTKVSSGHVDFLFTFQNLDPLNEQTLDLFVTANSTIGSQFYTGSTDTNKSKNFSSEAKIASLTIPAAQQGTVRLNFICVSAGCAAQSQKKNYSQSFTNGEIYEPLPAGSPVDGVSIGGHVGFSINLVGDSGAVRGHLAVSYGSDIFSTINANIAPASFMLNGGHPF